ncbi:cation:proton antiporter [Legionella septentrionalis]|uniref:Cyclic nucleotide-binding domain-containing protein n=1 Tax=Legionella septentrionalis TaxID=2498109 RepID=A0A433JK48_9GAMM|nr:cation:proton antiporter [Legionella septentrionalis]RUQ88840.1 cyclic nucleotide-binding domain-containing protein [Legionella septentrionalis]RUR16817.1 cyclic nucleotide-binding domain-containing protein [Legionella septentrionalis]
MALGQYLLPPAAQLVIAFVLLLVIAAITMAACSRQKWRFTIALVGIGLLIGHLERQGIGWLRFFNIYQLRPDFIFYLCLPTLLFESAYHIDIRQLKRNLAQILVLAIPGVLISTLLMGFIVHQFTSLNWLLALLLGAILSAIEPIAVLSLFQSLGAPKKLRILVEGESLFSDATAVILAKTFGIMLAIGMLDAPGIAEGGMQFLLKFLGGLLFGWLFAHLMGSILSLLKSQPQIEISLTTVLAYSSFIIAEQVLMVSGALAVVAAGLTMGNWGQTKISPDVTNYLEKFWGFAAYAVNALLFLLVGLNINISHTWHVLAEWLVVVVAMLISRAVVVFGLIPVSRLLPLSTKVNWRYQTVIFWGGLRGGVSLATVFGLQHFHGQTLLIDLVAGAVLFTLFAQGLTIERVIAWLGLNKIPVIDQLMKLDGLIVIKKQALQRLKQLKQAGLVSLHTANELKNKHAYELKEAEESLARLKDHAFNPKRQEQFLLNHMLGRELKALFLWFTQGLISETVYRNLRDTIHTQLDAVRHGGGWLAVSKILKVPSRLDNFLIRFIEPLPGMHWLRGRLQATRIARQYEEIWALHEGTKILQNALEELQLHIKFDEKITSYLTVQITHWEYVTQQQLEQMLHDFPTVIQSLQERLHEHMILTAEIELLKEEVRAGKLPATIAAEIIQECEQQMHVLKHKPMERVQLDAYDFLRNFYLFETLKDKEFSLLYQKFRSYTVPIGHEVIKEGDTGRSLFFIARGIIHVVRKKDQETELLATLSEGDFIGEISLIEDKPRNATCRAASPCVLYELRFKDFAEFKKDHPEIIAKIKQVAAKRGL